jgi:hypothetical protein
MIRFNSLDVNKNCSHSVDVCWSRAVGVGGGGGGGGG